MMLMIRKSQCLCMKKVSLEGHRVLECAAGWGQACCTVGVEQFLMVQVTLHYVLALACLRMGFYVPNSLHAYRPGVGG
jgi:hypothetical protein